MGVVLFFFVFRVQVWFDFDFGFQQNRQEMQTSALAAGLNLGIFLAAVRFFILYSVLFSPDLVRTIGWQAEVQPG